MIRLQTLGDASIRVGRRRIGPSAEQLFAVALYVASQRGRHIARDAMLDLIWPELGDSRRHNLRQILYKLRSYGVPLESDAMHIAIPEHEVEADYDVFFAWSEGVDPTPLTRESLGEFLPGYTSVMSPALAEWIETRRSEVHAQVRRVLLASLAVHRRRDEWGDVERVARSCLLLDPFNDEATLALAEATAMAGGKTEAVKMLTRYADEMGPGTKELKLPATVLRRRIMEGMTESDEYRSLRSG